MTEGRRGDGLRIWQLRAGPQGTLRVMRLGVDYVLARLVHERRPTIFEREGFAQDFPTVVERSSLERREERNA